MDTVHAVSKRIEQALTQLERELKRNGFEMPTDTFTVTTGNGITVEVASRPAPLPVEKSKAEVLEDFHQGFSEIVTGDTIPVSELRTEFDKLDDEESKPPRKLSK